MKWIAITACSIAVVGLAALYGLRNQLRSNFSGHDQPGALVGEYALLNFPAVNARGAERLEQWRKVAYEACADQRVESLARQLKTKATTVAVAKGYAGWADEPAVYEACLRGFSG